MTTPPPLLACPGCGSPANVSEAIRVGYIRCDKPCGFEVRAATEAEAITAWNKRAPDPALEALAAENGALIALLTECAAEIRVMSEWASGPTAEQYAALHSRVTATLERIPQP